LRGRDQQYRVAGAEIGEIRCRLDAGVEREVREIDRIAALMRDRSGDRRIARPQGHLPAGAARQAGERGAPGTAADNADVPYVAHEGRAHRLRLKAMEMRAAPPR
jgi:hypothetical protein